MLKIPPKVRCLVENVAVALATSDENNAPHVIVVACLKVVSRNKILITDNYMGKTGKNIKANSKIAIAVWSKDEKEGYQLKGMAERFVTGKWKRMVDEMDCNKNEPHKAAILVTAKEIYDLANPKLIFKED